MNDNDIAEQSILYWIASKGVNDEKGQPLSYAKKPYLLDILADWSQEIVIKKCAQIGGSVTFNIKVFFAILKFGWNIIYTMPTDDDVRNFVVSKTNQLIRENQHLFGKIDSDSVERKEIGKRFLYFKGTISKTAAISTSADLNVHDEADRSDQKTLHTYKSRLGASEFKGRWIFSNPTTEKGEIDLRWQKSDQKEWVIDCVACGAAQHMVWPDNIDTDRKIRICSQCKAPIGDQQLLDGRWEAQMPGRKVSGYHISHLMDVAFSAASIIEDSEGDQEYFYNFVLGEPYSPGDLSVSRSTILDLWTPRDLRTPSLFLGVDVGNIKHYVLGSEKGIFKVGKFTEWNDLDDIIRFYKPVAGVIDAMPDNTMSRYYVKTYPQMRMSFFQENAANPQQIVWFGENDKAGIVYSNRNRVIDQLIDDLVNARFLIGLPGDKDLREYIKHWLTMRRLKVTNTRGIESYEWDSTTGVDHYCFATLYYWLALKMSGAGAVMQSDDIPVSAVIHRSDGDFVNLQEFLESRD